MDVDTQLKAVARRIETKEVDGALSIVQTLAQTYPSPIDDVWNAVTTVERIPRWFLPVSGELRLGGHFQFEGNAGGFWEQFGRRVGRGAHRGRRKPRSREGCRNNDLRHVHRGTPPAPME
jgi:hypothetical protein